MKKNQSLELMEKVENIELQLECLRKMLKKDDEAEEEKWKDVTFDPRFKDCETHPTNCNCIL